MREWFDRLFDGSATRQDWMYVAYICYCVAIAFAGIAAMTWHPLIGVVIAGAATAVTDAFYFIKVHGKEDE